MLRSSWQKRKPLELQCLETWPVDTRNKSVVEAPYKAEMTMPNRVQPPRRMGFCLSLLKLGARHEIS
jgi:hypothetical protein